MARMIEMSCALLFISFSMLVAKKPYIINVESCVRAENNVEKTTKNKNGLFSLYYGDAGLEVFNSVHANEMKQIIDLAKCVQQEDPTKFLDSSNIEIQRGLTAESNVTYLTGVYQAILPKIHAKLITAAKLGIKKAELPTKVESLGIRSVQYVSFDKEGIEEYKADLRKRVEAERVERSSKFVIHSPESAAEVQRLNAIQFDPESDSAVEPLLGPANQGTVYFMVLALSDRADFVGGEILVRKKRTITADEEIANTRYSRKVSSEDTDEEEEEDEEIADEKEKEKLMEKFINYKVLSRFTPDKSSILLIKGGHDQGTRAPTYGSRHLLVIEFWEYADAAVGSTNPRLNEGVPRMTNGKEDL